MPTGCGARQLEFAGVGRRRVAAAFDGGRISSDGGALLLKSCDEAIGRLDRLTDCFSDRRTPCVPLRMLLDQRVMSASSR